MNCAGCERLVAQHQHLVLQEPGLQFGRQVGRHPLRKVDPGDFGTQGAGHLPDLHGLALLNQRLHPNS
jgi:hypothetical protein